MLPKSMRNQMMGPFEVGMNVQWLLGGATKLFCPPILSSEVRNIFLSKIQILIYSSSAKMLPNCLPVQPGKRLTGCISQLLTMLIRLIFRLELLFMLAIFSLALLLGIFYNTCRFPYIYLIYKVKLSRHDNDTSDGSSQFCAPLQSLAFGEYEKIRKCK